MEGREGEGKRGKERREGGKIKNICGSKGRKIFEKHTHPSYNAGHGQAHLIHFHSMLPSLGGAITVFHFASGKPYLKEVVSSLRSGLTGLQPS